MKVQIQERQIVIGEEALPVYGYYIAIEAERTDQSGAMVVQDVLSQWAEAIARLGDGGMAFLPYGLEDEWVECVEARRNSETISFRRVAVAANGYALALDDLSEFMLSPQRLDHLGEYPEVFAEYDRGEIISALKGAEIAAA